MLKEKCSSIGSFTNPQFLSGNFVVVTSLKNVFFYLAFQGNKMGRFSNTLPQPIHREEYEIFEMIKGTGEIWI